MNKEKLKGKVLKEGKEQYLSAQEYGLMTIAEKQSVREVLQEEKIDPDEYERGMKKLWPKEFKPEPLAWRRR